jgi:hypothetical protein
MIGPLGLPILSTFAGRSGGEAVACTLSPIEDIAFDAQSAVVMVPATVTRRAIGDAGVLRQGPRAGVLICLVRGERRDIVNR